MPKRKTKKIETLFSQRLEEFLQTEKLKKYELAEMIHTSPQTISKACNGTRLTKATAEEIIKHFPQYNLAWLLGQEGALKYIEDERDAELGFLSLSEFVESAAQERYLECLEHICREQGYRMDIDYGQVTIQGRTGKEIVLQLDELSEFIEDVNAFMAYRLAKLLKKGH